MTTWLWPNGSTTKPHITDDYGWGIDPKTGLRRFHYGDDFTGFDENCSVGAGVVSAIGDFGDGGGWQVRVDHGNISGVGRVESRYKHNVNGFAFIAIGSNVRPGQRLAKQGSSGYATGKHLHLDVLINGVRVNPSVFLAPRIGAGGGAGGFTPSEENEMFGTWRLALTPAGNWGAFWFTNTYGAIAMTSTELEAIKRDNTLAPGGIQQYPDTVALSNLTRRAAIWLIEQIDNSISDEEALAAMEAKVDNDPDFQIDIAALADDISADVAAKLANVLGPLADQIANLVDADGADQALRERIVQLLEGGLSGTVVLTPKV